MVTCKECGASFPDANFCANCGARLVEAKPARQSAEQRHLTVLFCDLVGSTQLTEQLGAEAYHELLTAYQQMVAQAVDQFQGHVAQYLGDGVLVYFGFPTAHEDDPRRALLTATAIIRGAEDLNRSAGLPTVSVRIGVHAGMVVAGKVGGGTSKYDLALGLAPNVAARLQAIAEPGTIVVSDVFRRLVEGFFTYDDIGRQPIKGVSEPMQLYVVTGIDTHSRHQASSVSGLTKFVGREEEISRLSDLWRKTCEGQFSVALIQGEGGIGKSRLTRAVCDFNQAGQAALTDCECSPLHSNTTLFPVTEMLKAQIFQQNGPVEPEHQLELLERYLFKLGLDLPASVPLIAPLLNIPFEPRYAAPVMGPELKRQKTIDLLVALIGRSRKPHLIIFEDLQWADATTMELVMRLVDERSEPSVMMVLNARPEFVPPWRARGPDYTVQLERLPETELNILIRQVARQHALPDSVAEQIIQASDGVPLFAEELTKAVVESITHNPGMENPEQLVPETLSASLTARLDRMGGAKEIAQRASVLGRRFQYDQLRAIAGEPEEKLREALDDLIGAGLVHSAGSESQLVYQFNHVLVQVAAYNSMLRRTRVELHGELVKCLEADFPEVVASTPELLAHHSQKAELIPKSIDYWFRAGRAAFARSANVEAAAHLRAGRELAARLDDPAERVLRELKLLTLLGPALIATTGFASDEVGEVYDTARELCELMPDNPDLFPVLMGSWVFFLVKGDLENSRRYADQMLQLGKQTGDDNLLVEAHYALGNSLYWLGELEQALGHLEAADGLYDEKKHRAHILLFGQDPGVTARCYLSFTHWMMGNPDKAWDALESAENTAAPLNHAFTTAWPMAFRVLLHSHRREPAEALEAAEKLIAFAMEEHQVYWLQAAIIVRGWAAASGGEAEGGVAAMRQGIADYAATGARVSLPHFRALLAEILIGQGDYAEAEAELSRAFAEAAVNREPLAEIDLWRLRAELADSTGQHDRALECAGKAVGLAEEKGANGPGRRAADRFEHLLGKH